MLGFRSFKLLNKFFMTLPAKSGSLILEVVGKLRPVRAVTFLAGFLYWLVDELFFKTGFLILVTIKAKGNSIGL
jgi:hypothetical protein